jgi:hypothetical protein
MFYIKKLCENSHRSSRHHKLRRVDQHQTLTENNIRAFSPTILVTKKESFADNDIIQDHIENKQL